MADDYECVALSCTGQVWLPVYCGCWGTLNPGKQGWLGKVGAATAYALLLCPCKDACIGAVRPLWTF
jgi:hypothetical protein